MIDLLQTILISIAAFSIAYLVFPFVLRLIRPLQSDGRLGVLLGSRRNHVIDSAYYCVVFIALIGLSAQALHDYESFSSWYEFSWNIDRVVSGLLRGNSLLPYLADRYNPFVVAFVPFYAVWKDPRALLLVQSIGLGFTALPLYWLAQREIGRVLGFALGLAYLVSAYVQNLNTGDIFELKFSVPLLALAGFFLLRGRYLPFFISLGVALLVKEDVAVVAFSCSLFILFVQGKRLLGFSLALLSVIPVLAVTEVLYPYFHSGHPFYIWAERYAYLGNTFGQIALTVLQRPSILIEQISDTTKIEYVSYLLGPLAMLAIAGIEATAIMTPVLFFDLLSTWSTQSTPTQYYQSPIVPFVFIGAIIGAKRILQLLQAEQARARFSLLLLVVVSTQLYLPTTWLRLFSPGSFFVDQHDSLGRQLILEIPPGTKVVSQLEFVLPMRGMRQHDVVTFSPHGDYRNADYIFGDSSRFWYGFFKPAWEHWRASGYFDVVTDQDGYFLLSRKMSIDPSRQYDNGWALLGYTAAPNPFDQPVNLDFENGMRLLGYSAVPSDKIQTGQQLRLIVEWLATRDIESRYFSLAHLQDARGHAWAQVDRGAIIPTNRWKAGDIIRDEYDFELPRIMPPGTDRLTIGVWDPQGQRSLKITDANGKDRGIEAELDTLSVERDHSSFPAEYLQIERPLQLDLAELRLLGTTAIPQTAGAGELEVGLYWQARLKPAGDYVVAVQLRDANDRVVWEQAGPPAAGAYPTPLWQSGEIVLDWHDLELPRDISPGDYALTVVLRRQENQTEVGMGKIGTLTLTGK